MKHTGFSSLYYMLLEERYFPINIVLELQVLGSNLTSINDK